MFTGRRQQPMGFAALLLLQALLVAGRWQPEPEATFQYLVDSSGEITADVDVAVIDLYDGKQVSSSEQMHRTHTLCWFSAGTLQTWLTDTESIVLGARGNAVGDWGEEYWLDITDDSVRQVMRRRVLDAASRGCSGIAPGNVDGYENSSGFSLTWSDQLLYNYWLAEQAHAANMTACLVNDVAQTHDLSGVFDCALIEHCFRHDTCDQAAAFINSNKAVFRIERHSHSRGISEETVCPAANRARHAALIRHRDAASGSPHHSLYVPCWAWLPDMLGSVVALALAGTTAAAGILVLLRSVAQHRRSGYYAM